MERNGERPEEAEERTRKGGWESLRRGKSGWEKEDVRLQLRVHDLDSQQPSRLSVDSLMNLRQTRNSDRDGVERREESRHGLTGLRQEERLNLVERRREALILEGLHGERPWGGDELDGREMLTELYEEKESASLGSGGENGARVGGTIQVVGN